MWSLLRRNQNECSRLRDALETAGELAPQLLAHLSDCADCRAAAEELQKSRALLRGLPSNGAQASPWFVARVMTAIAARESELRRSAETWTVVPRLAARLTWISALVLLLAGTWLYEMPRSAQSRSSSDTTAESLFDPSPSPAAQDDVLATQVERAQ
jgi:hypothetical protein